VVFSRDRAAVPFELSSTLTSDQYVMYYDACSSCTGILCTEPVDHMDGRRLSILKDVPALIRRFNVLLICL